MYCKNQQVLMSRMSLVFESPKSLSVFDIRFIIILPPSPPLGEKLKFYWHSINLVYAVFVVFIAKLI